MSMPRSTGRAEFNQDLTRVRMALTDKMHMAMRVEMRDMSVMAAMRNVSFESQEGIPGA
jgi:hypothetical protein